MQHRVHLAHARALLGMVPSLDAHANAPGRDPIGVGMMVPYRPMARPVAACPPVGPAAGFAPVYAQHGSFANPYQVPTLNIEDRAVWSKFYMAIEIPVNSTELEPSGVVAGATLQMKPSSQVTVWITDFTVDTDEPSDFIITELTISRVNLIGGSGGIPASRFRQNSRRPQINNEILCGGSFAKVTIQNINKESTLDFYGTFEGLDLSRAVKQSL